MRTSGQPGDELTQMHTRPNGQRQCSGVTLIELLFFLAALTFSLVVVSYFDSFGLGLIGFLIGLPLTFIASFFVIWAIIAVYASIEGLFTGIPFLPTCDRCGSKSGWLTGFGDYDLVEHGDEWGWKCRCGRVFVHDRKRRRVMEIGSDGLARPYMIWKAFRGWKKDAD